MKEGSDKKKATGKRVKSGTSSSTTDQKAVGGKYSQVVEKYARGSVSFNTKSVKHKNLRKTLEETRERNKDAAAKTAAAEVLLPSTPGFIELDNPKEKVYKLKQASISQNVDLNTAKNIFDFQLTKFGPYTIKCSRNGRYALFAGRSGHIASYDYLRTKVGMELQVQEEVHDVQFLHNESLFAAAQQRYAYIYDHNGVEIHCMKRHERPLKLDFLPYHFLLTSVGHSGWIKWHDVSTGEYVAGYQTGHGPVRVLKHNPSNAVSHVGHSNGVVSLWSPSAGKALVSMFCHKSPVLDLAVDREGRYMATTGLDGFLKIWDLRKLTPLHTYRTTHPAVSVDISDRGLLGMAVGRTVQILRNTVFTAPTARDLTYLSHEIRTPNAALSSGAGAAASARALLSNVAVTSVNFRPLEDVLCVGHSHGVTSLVVPGAGEPNYDSYESNPFINPRQRREGEVQSLLNKLSHEMIGLDSSFVAGVEKDKRTLEEDHKALFQIANKNQLEKKEKNRKRGRNKIAAKLRRKQKNVVDAQVLKLRDKLKQQKEEREQQQTLGKNDGGKGANNSQNSSIGNNLASSSSNALNRFAKPIRAKSL